LHGGRIREEVAHAVSLGRRRVLPNPPIALDSVPCHRNRLSRR
jgi:hypothetical protein